MGLSWFRRVSAPLVNPEVGAATGSTQLQLCLQELEDSSMSHDFRDTQAAKNAIDFLITVCFWLVFLGDRRGCVDALSFEGIANLPREDVVCSAQSCLEERHGPPNGPNAVRCSKCHIVAHTLRRSNSRGTW